jgi:hypothetical protein
MNQGFELNLARLASLVKDIRSREVSDPPWSMGSVLRSELLADPEIMALVPTVAWSTLGVSVWLAGRHLPSRSIPEIEAMTSQFIDNHIAKIIELIESHK